MWLLILTTLSLASLGYCGNFTVTEEAFFDIEIQDLDGEGQDYKGRFVIALFGDAAPVTVLNFASITRGFKTNKGFLHYKNTPVHRIVTDFVVQMGDITKGDGTGGRSVYGKRFNDEEFVLSHRAPGWVAMANHGKDTNGSQFFILLTKSRWLDGKHVVFGKVIRGMKTVRVMGEVPTGEDGNTPTKSVRIVACGLNGLRDRYDLTKKQLDMEEDL